MTSCVNKLTIPNEDLSAKFHLVCEVAPGQPITAVLYTTTDANGLNPVEFPPDAEITISEVGKDDSFGLVFDENELFYASASGSVSAGKSYEIRCNTFNSILNNISAMTKIPRKSGIDTIIIDSTTKIETEEGVFFSSDLSIVFEDPEIKPAYFHLIPQTEPVILSEDPQGNPIYTSNGSLQNYIVTDILEGLNGTEILKHRDGFLVDHSRLIDQTLKVRMVNAYALTNEELLAQVFIKVKSVSESYYRYHVAESRISAAGNNGGGPIPISYTNFDEGYGAFTSYNTSENTFPLR